MSTKENVLIEALEGIAAAHNLDLVTIEIAGTPKNPILRVFLDTYTGGITVDELADAQLWVDAKIEELDPFQGSYTLEVSSPGVDRPLRKPNDFERFAGEQVRILYKQNSSQKRCKGLLLGISDNEVLVQMPDGEQKRIALLSIKRANIIAKLDFTGVNRAVAAKTKDTPEKNKSSQNYTGSKTIS